MATLKKMTRVGADVRQIARLLQAKAPENHMLAYITPEEAELLKSQGGSGKEHADTGIPSFEVGATGMGSDFYYEGTADTSPVYFSQEPAPTYLPPMAAPFNATAPFASFDVSQYAPAFSAAPNETTFAGPPAPESLPSADRFAIYGPSGYGPSVSPTEIAPIDTTPSKTFGERYSDLAKSLGVKEDTLTRLGLGGLQAALGARQARLAKEEAQKAKEEQQKIAAPYQTKGAELQRQAQAGELTPVARQQLQTVQAQAAQAASARGGVGAQQTAARVEAMRNQLLQQQYDYGLKLSGIGDQLALGAIRTGLEADRYVNQLSNTYYTNIARTLVGSPTVIQYGVTQ
jgi:hypothetical protein